MRLSVTQIRRPFSISLFTAFSVAALLAVFYLPYYIALQPTESVSYTFGYNNRAGIVLLLLVLAGLAIWTKGAGLSRDAAAESPKIPSTTLAIALLAVLAACWTMYTFAGRFGGFGESTYEIDRTWLVLQGKTPYVDFEWPFGVSFLYLPLALKAVCSLTLFQASYLFWGLNFLVGTFLLYVSINMIDYPTRSKKSIFALFFAAGCLSILFMGTHYTFLRYTLPIFLVLCVTKVAGSAGKQQRILAAVGAVAGTMLLLAISPETAIAHAFACACILPPTCADRNGRTLVVYGGLLLADVLVFALALKLHILDTVRASEGGADSFPIVPSLHIFFFFSALFLCACYLFQRFTGERTDKRPSDNTLGILAFSLPMLAAALGRCDPVHVLWNGEGVLLASMFYVSNRKIAWRAYRTAFLAIFILLAGLTQGISYLHPLARVGLEKIAAGNASATVIALDSFGRRYLASHGSPTARARWTSRLNDVWRYSVPDRIDFAALYPSWRGKFFAPFLYRPNGLGSYLSGDVDYGHYEGIENANTTAAIQAKILEMNSRPDEALLLPDGFQGLCATSITDDQALIRLLFAAPYSRRALHPENIRHPVCDYIHRHYREVEAPDKHNFYYGLWVPAVPAE